jgi:hypothetical protein
MNLPFLNTTSARTQRAAAGMALSARRGVCADLMSLNAIAPPAARRGSQAFWVTRWRSLSRLGGFHDNAVRSLPEERTERARQEIAARTLALPDLQRVEGLNTPRC